MSGNLPKGYSDHYYPSDSLPAYDPRLQKRGYVVESPANFDNEIERAAGETLFALVDNAAFGRRNLPRETGPGTSPEFAAERSVPAQDLGGTALTQHVESLQMIEGAQSTSNLEDNVVPVVARAA